MVLVVKKLPASAGDIRDLDSIPASRGSLGKGCGNPLQYFIGQPSSHEVAKMTASTSRLIFYVLLCVPLEQSMNQSPWLKKWNNLMSQAWSVAWRQKICGKIIAVLGKTATKTIPPQTYKWLEWNIETIWAQAPHLEDTAVKPGELLYFPRQQLWGNPGWNICLPPPYHPASSQASLWPLPCSYPLDKSISTHEGFPLSSLYTKWTGKKEMLVKTNLYLVFSIYGTISVTCQSLCCKIALPTHNPHFLMTPACQSLTTSKPNFMPSKAQFVNHFACHTSAIITCQPQLLLSNGPGLVKLVCVS